MRNVIALRILRKHLKGGRVPIFLKNPFACSTPTFHRVTGHDRGTISLSRDDSNCPAKSFHKVFFLPSSCLDADSTKVEVLFSRRDHACCRNGAIIIEFSTRCELPRRKLRGRDDGNLLAAAPATPEYPSIPELLVTRVAIYIASDSISRFLPSDPSFVHDSLIRGL